MTRHSGRPRLSIQVLASEIGVSVGGIHLNRDEAIALCTAILDTLDHHQQETTHA